MRITNNKNTFFRMKVEKQNAGVVILLTVNDYKRGKCLQLVNMILFYKNASMREETSVN